MTVSMVAAMTIIDLYRIFVPGCEMSDFSDTGRHLTPNGEMTEPNRETGYAESWKVMEEKRHANN